MVCQPRVCISMRNTKYCTVEVASEQASINLVLRKIIRLDIPEAFYTL